MRAENEMCSNQNEDRGVEGDKVKTTDIIRNIGVNELEEFKNHPFKVEENSDLYDLAKSIEKDGVLVPLLARPNKSNSGYEIIAGHRRKAACKLAGVSVVPVIIRELDDNQAVIAMVDSNLQREKILPSEKAFAYKMKLEAMKQQGKRTDLTSCQLGKKSDDNPTVELSKVGSQYDELGNWQIVNNEDGESRIDSHKQLAIQTGESKRQIARYICLTNLIPQILKMVDDEKIAFTIAVELSYLKESEQYELYAVMDLEQCTPSLAQANRLKRRSQAGELDMDEIYIILEEEKPNQKEKIKIRSDLLDPYFPKDFTPVQKIELIQELVKEWYKKQNEINLFKEERGGSSRSRR